MKLKKILVVLFAGFVIFSNTATLAAQALALEAAVIGVTFTALVAAWAAAAATSGTSINYSSVDFAPYGHTDSNGRFILDDVTGAANKVNRDYTQLANEMQNNLNTKAQQALDDYIRRNTELQNLDNTLTLQQKLDIANAFLEQKVAQAQADLQAGNITFDEYNRIATENSAINDTRNIFQIIDDLANGNMSPADMEHYLDSLTQAQKQLFQQFCKECFGEISGTISVMDGMLLSYAQLTQMVIPYATEFYLTPNQSIATPFFNGYQYTHFYYTNGVLYEDLHNATYQKISFWTIGEGRVDYGGFYKKRENLQFTANGMISYTIGSFATSSNEMYDSTTASAYNPFNSFTSIDYIFSSDAPIITDSGIETNTTDAKVNTNGVVAEDGTSVVPTIEDILNEISDVPIDMTDATTAAATITQDLTITAELPDLTLPDLVITKFPFCLPFDLYKGMRLLAVPEKPPVFEIDFDIPIAQALGGGSIPFDMTIDLTQFETFAKLTRWGSTFAFVFLLILTTPKVVKGAGI